MLRSELASPSVSVESSDSPSLCSPRQKRALIYSLVMDMIEQLSVDEDEENDDSTDVLYESDAENEVENEVENEGGEEEVVEEAEDADEDEDDGLDMEMAMLKDLEVDLEVDENWFDFVNEAKRIVTEVCSVGDASSKLVIQS
eukprot:TRINITY_DN3929_c0_g1_i1.p1 TRINITY_DN3929_c0_g1~~TRINITY_DN3929_c0_g1_i1.p1  ORF type:complete len:143 (-),score=43.34 TRINITY_DN3929_c0_g1_i1:109-537(-)